MSVAGVDIEFTEGVTSLEGSQGLPSKGTKRNDLGNSDGRGIKPSRGSSKNRSAGSDNPSKAVKKIDYQISNVRR